MEYSILLHSRVDASIMSHLPLTKTLLQRLQQISISTKRRYINFLSRAPNRTLASSPFRSLVLFGHYSQPSIPPLTKLRFQQCLFFHTAGNNGSDGLTFTDKMDGSVTASSFSTAAVQLKCESIEEGKKIPRRSDDGTAKNLSPKEIVKYLDKYIIGQHDAKKAVANALRQRWRRQQLSEESIKADITPKNIVMIGPTGVGKTEIARKLSKLVDAPFLKVEATKFTEVGFHGRDVDQIIKDLVELAVKKQRTKLEAEYRPSAEDIANERILEALLGKLTEIDRVSWLQHLQGGLLDERVINVEVPLSQQHAGDPIETAIREAMSQHSSIKSVKVVQHGGGRVTERKSLTVKEAKEKLIQAELETMINQEMIHQTAVQSVEQEGIVFVDEIDKICTKNHGGYSGPDASAEGVQRDLLPLIEGCSVSTRYGNVKTDYILFIASGAFHNVKPSDMLAELQGRLPVKVQLKSLEEEDFVRILKETQNNLIVQSAALLETEGVTLNFTDDAIREVAKVSFEINTHIENIGARRLHTVLERILEDINFEAPNMEEGSCVVVDANTVRQSVTEFLSRTDLSKYIL